MKIEVFKNVLLTAIVINASIYYIVNAEQFL